MENFSYHVPVFVVTGGVATSGHSSELKPGQVGLFDRNTFSVATGGGNGVEFFLAQGAIGGKDWFGSPIGESHKSAFFMGKDIEDIFSSLPKTIQNEEWVLGYNGSASSIGLSFEKGKAVRVKMYFHGDPVYRFFGGPKEYVVSYTPSEDCAAPCTEEDCPEAITDCLTHTNALIDAINMHTELKKFGVQAKRVTKPYVASTVTMTNWCLSICDTGDILALWEVQAQAPAGVKVSRTSRVDSTSTYSFCQAEDADDPADFAKNNVDTAWTDCGDGISSVRTIKLVGINKTDGGGDRLANITSVITGIPGINIGTLTRIAGDGCVDDYTVTQNSQDCFSEDECLTNVVTFNYEMVPSFENVSWEVVPPVITPDPDRKCGIRISAGYIDPKFGNCSFDPMDYYETQPIKMEVSLLAEDGSACDYATMPTQHQSKVGRIARQSGEYVAREVLMKTNAYLKHVDQYSNSPRMREAFDMNLLNMVDRNAFYKLYYVRFKASYGKSFRKNEQEKFTAIFAIKEGVSTTSFDTNVIGVLQTKSNGVVLHSNG